MSTLKITLFKLVAINKSINIDRNKTLLFFSEKPSENMCSYKNKKHNIQMACEM